MSLRRESVAIDEKAATMGDKLPEEPPSFGDHVRGRQFSVQEDDLAIVSADQNALHRDLKGRHMQMIAIGGAIGAGLFVGSAGAFATGGPASVFLGFLIVGVMIYFVMQALAELAVMYPINGAFTMYICRFMDPAWGFACGWNYALSWLCVLPFEISAACNIIHYWPGSEGINDSAWIVPLLVALVAIQFFGVRGYGEVEFVLSALKILACTGFIILAIVINCGGVIGDPSGRGYIGGRYWHAPYSAFLNGFHGFCTVFVTASFAFNGTELTGLAAAETANPRKEIPKASNQVVWRIGFFYIINLLLIGLIIPCSVDPAAGDLTGDGPESRSSPFVIAIMLAGINYLPSIFNAVILISVMSVANSCTFGSTRTIQALAANGMAPKIFAYVDRKGRPVSVIILQLLFGLLAFINLAENGGTIFNWLLALSGLSTFFVYGSICISHMRFRKAWKHNGHSLDELPFRASCGVWGSWFALLIVIIALMAQFYVALYPVGGPYLDAEAFFEAYLAGPVIVFFYLGWKIYSLIAVPKDRPLFIRTKDIDIYTGMRENQRTMISGVDVSEDQRRASIAELQEERKKKPLDYLKAAGRTLF